MTTVLPDILLTESFAYPNEVARLATIRNSSSTNHERISIAEGHSTHD